MPNNTRLSEKERVSSIENTNTRETLWKGFGDRTDVLLLGAGLFLLLINVVVIFCLDTNLDTLLFYLNMRYWSVYISIVLWMLTLWIAAESTDITEDYIPFIRITIIPSILLVIFFAMLNSTNAVRPGGYSFWFYVVSAVIVCCAVRSSYILYNYQHGEGNFVDLDEEVKWFLGLSGFIFAILFLVGVLYVIPVRIPRGETGDFFSIPLLTILRRNLEVLIRNGAGSFGLRILGFLIVTTAIAFVYTIGKWIHMLWIKWREE